MLPKDPIVLLLITDKVDQSYVVLLSKLRTCISYIQLLIRNF